ncbi:hypothetical protein N7540_004442 [Penicillium herquei]|nr:hypothetical protein N7540_004442 [Penicillium herquei]
MTTTSATKTSMNLGPLTTTFTPPSDCFTEKWVKHGNSSDDNTLMWGWGCPSNGVGEASTCYQLSQYEAIVVWKWGKATGDLNYVFSPGYICPSGYEAAFSSTYGYTANTDYDLKAASVTMVPGDTLTACCPS